MPRNNAEIVCNILSGIRPSVRTFVQTFWLCGSQALLTPHSQILQADFILYFGHDYSGLVAVTHISEIIMELCLNIL